MNQPVFKKILLCIGGAAALWLGARYLLPIAMPFLLAALLALAAEPLVSALQSRTHLPRGAATGLGVSIALVILILTVMVLGALLLRQVQRLTAMVPDLEGSALSGIRSLEDWLLVLAGKAPAGIRNMLSHSVENFFSDSTELVDRLTGRVLSLASGVVSRLPDSALGIGTWLLASYMISAKLPRITAWLTARLPGSWHKKYLPALRRMKRSLLGWLNAQFKLIGITFGVLTGGFYLLRIRNGMLWAVLISLMDALPVLGSGMVLVPWSLVCFLQGEAVRGIGLLGVYAVAALLRSVLEPRFVGRQLGLDPLVTLAAMYAGYRLWGFPGMIAAPLLAVTAAQVIAPDRGQ